MSTANRRAYYKNTVDIVALLRQIDDSGRPSWCATGIGAGRPQSIRLQKYGRLKRTPTPKTKKPLSGGAEQRRSRSRRKSLVKNPDTGELCESATTLQEKRGHSGYGVRNEGKRAGGGR
ncbi:hypothetical protein NDU88_006007 [Pleurodeles waltl]|uniref:Uncharacterized protein n=1 Tax=Pleurodeles waltl TaxID=8319 RepID=A0AAV7MBN0_PLEWA|nr:hypothetical protein NDU88_006007 [Pleurodeles waltl]